MSQLMELIDKYCPHGVQFRELGEISSFIGGLTGKSKQDFVNGNKKFVTYMNVYNNPSVDTSAEDMVVIHDGERQNKLCFGDIIITGSSETPDDSCMSSVLDTPIDDDLYLNSFCFALRLNEPVLLPRFSSYLFRSTEIRKQLVKTVSGVTRFNVSKEKMKFVKIPIPPIEIQEEIVRVLDNFSELVAGLQSEIEKRKMQYEHYRDAILDFDKNGIEHDKLTIVDVCSFVTSGGTPKSTTKEYYGGDIPWLRTQEVDWTDIYDTGVKITQLGYDNSSAKMIKENCVIVAMYGATAGKVAINRIPLCTNQACCNLEINPEKALFEYVYYCLSKDYLVLKGKGQGSQSNINAGIVKGHPICVPQLEIQLELVKKIQTFTTAIESLQEELELRIKQFEYYRDKLLTFNEES